MWADRCTQRHTGVCMQCERAMGCLCDSVPDRTSNEIFFLFYTHNNTQTSRTSREKKVSAVQDTGKSQCRLSTQKTVVVSSRRSPRWTPHQGANVCLILETLLAENDSRKLDEISALLHTTAMCVCCQGRMRSPWGLGAGRVGDSSKCHAG